MTTRAVIQGSVDPFLDRAISSDGPPAVKLVLDLLDQGASVESVILDVLAPAQRESGQRWLRNEWTVADEHVVSGVTQRALDAVANTATTRSPTGAVVVACAEGDWHSLPSQMFAEILRDRGYKVTFLGASTPADYLARLLTRDRPEALIVTCNLPLFFSGVTTLADAAHRSGVRVIAGGRALTCRARAERLAADAWAPDASGVIATLGEWAAHPPAIPDPTGRDLTGLQLDSESAALAGAALHSMMESYPRMRNYAARQLARTEEDLASIVRFTAAAHIVHDPSVLTDFLDWLTELLAARGVPLGALTSGLFALAPGVEAFNEEAGMLLQHGVRHLSQDHLPVGTSL